MDHQMLSAHLSYLLTQMHARAIVHDAFRALDGDEGPLLLIDSQSWHLVWIERGQETSRQSFSTATEVIFRILADSAFAAGVVYEFANRIDGPDIRRLIHAKQRELFARLEPKWLALLDKDIAATLLENPYVDQATMTP